MGRLSSVFSKYFNITNFNTQAAILGILDSVSNNSLFENNEIFINHILLIFKLYVYKPREKNS